MSVLSSLSYRKRPSLKDSIGGRGDEQTLFSALSERVASPERAARRARGTEHEDRAAVIARAFADASGRARQGLGKRWSLSAGDGEKGSVASAPVSRASSASWRAPEDGDEGDEGCSVLSFALSSPGSLRSRRSGADGRPDSRLSLARSLLDEADDASRGQPPLGRSFSVPPRPRSAASEDGPPGDARPVGHRSYLDPDLEAAIQEVLSYRSPRAGGLSSPDSGDDGRSVRSVRSAAPLGAADRPGSLRRSASALEVSRPSRRSGRRRSSSSSESSSSSSEEEEERKRKSAKKKSKKSKKKSKKKKKKSSSESGSDSSSDSSSGSTVSYRSTSSVKKGPRAAGGEEPVRPDRARKEEKRRKKQVDSLMMKYLYRPESD